MTYRRTFVIHKCGLTYSVGMAACWTVLVYEFYRQIFFNVPLYDCLTL